jgi:hypothetical protein
MGHHGQWDILNQGVLVQYCPLARHATLDELTALTSLFNPKSLSPNTIAAGLLGCDYYMMHEVFAMTSNSANLQRESLAWFAHERNLHTKVAVDDLLKRVFQVDEDGQFVLIPVPTSRKRRLDNSSHATTRPRPPPPSQLTGAGSSAGTTRQWLSDIGTTNPSQTQEQITPVSTEFEQGVTGKNSRSIRDSKAR